MSADISTRIIRGALDLGINFIDTAANYTGGESERIIGAALGANRDQVVIATKGHTLDRGELSVADHLTRSVEASLRRLKTDYIDLYQIHRADPAAQTADVVEVLDALVTSGKVRSIGCSNYASWRVAESLAVAHQDGFTGFTTVQAHYNLLSRHVERELVGCCRQYALSLIPYYPLASGFLTGKYHPGEVPHADTRAATRTDTFARIMTESNWMTLKALEQFASERDHSVGDLALAWLAASDVVSTVIAGASRVAQLERNAEGIAWELTPEEKSAVDSLTANGAEVSAELPAGARSR